MNLQIDYQLGSLGMNARIPSIKVIQSEADFSMKQRVPRVDINIDLPQVQIRHKRCYESMGLKDPLAFRKELSQKAIANSIEEIGKIAQMGDHLAKIDKGHTIADLGIMARPTPRESNVALMPSVSPEISFTGGIKIGYEPGDIIYKTKPSPLVVEAPRGKVDFYVEKKPYIKITAKKNE